MKEIKITEVPSGSEHILVVEYEDSERNLIQKFIEQKGYEVTTASDGGKALLLMEEKGLRPDLIIIDAVMSKMGGKELIEHMKQNLPHLKVLYMSSYTDNTITHHGVVDWSIPFIQKPLKLERLAAKIREILDKKRSMIRLPTTYKTLLMSG